MNLPRIVITGIGLTSPNGNSLSEFRENLLAGKGNIQLRPVKFMGDVPAGVCNFEATRYQKKRDIRTGTRAGSIAIYCANEALKNAGFAPEDITDEAKARMGVYLGITEHGTVETLNEALNIREFDDDVKYWSHHHNPRTVANNPAGEVTLNLGITGPHLTLGAACAAGNAGLIQAAYMLQLGEVDVALGGGVSESTESFGIFAGFKSQGALAITDEPSKASRPFDTSREGIVVAEGGCIYILERLEDAQARGADIIAELVGWAMNSDATDTVLPNATRQAQCMHAALKRAGLTPQCVDILSTHATSTPQGDAQECAALREVFGPANGSESPHLHVNNTKSYIGHAMGAAGALELAGNIPSFTDMQAHPTLNVENLDPACEVPGLVLNKAKAMQRCEVIFNNSFGMLGINSAVILKKFTA